MSVQPCGTPAGMMMMSPFFTARFTTSAPAIVPLHDGPFRIFVTSLSADDFRPLTMWPPVTSVPPPDTMRYPSVCESCVIPPGVPLVGGGLACSPQGSAARTAMDHADRQMLVADVDDLDRSIDAGLAVDYLDLLVGDVGGGL